MAIKRSCLVVWLFVSTAMADFSSQMTFDMLPGELLNEIGSYLNICSVNNLVQAYRVGSGSWMHEQLKLQCKNSENWVLRERLPFNLKKYERVITNTTFLSYNRLMVVYPNLDDLTALPFVTHLVIYTNLWDSQEWFHLRRIAPTLESLHIYITALSNPRVFDKKVDMRVFSVLKSFKLFINSVCIRVLNEETLSLHHLFPMKSLESLTVSVPARFITEGIEILFALPHLRSISLCDTMLSNMIPEYGPVLKEIHLLMPPDEYQRFRYMQIISSPRRLPQEVSLLNFHRFPSSLEVLTFQSQCVNIEHLNNALANTTNVEIVADVNCHIRFVYEVIGKLGDVASIVNDNLRRNAYVLPVKFSKFHDVYNHYSFFSVFKRCSVRSCDYERTMQGALGEHIKYVYRKKCYCCTICGRCREHNNFQTYVSEYRKDKSIFPKDESVVFNFFSV